MQKVMRNVLTPFYTWPNRLSSPADDFINISTAILPLFFCALPSSNPL